jgi:hypothetical protein
MLIPTREGQLAHLATQACYLALHCWDHPVVTDNRLWYQGRSATISQLVLDAAGKTAPGSTLRLSDVPSYCWNDLAALGAIRIARPQEIGFKKTRFDILDLQSMDAFEIKPDTEQWIREGQADLDVRIGMFNAVAQMSQGARPDIAAALALEGWRAKLAHPGTNWPREPVILPIGLTTWIQVRLVPGTGVLAWKKIKARRRRRPRQPTLEDIDDLREHLQNAVQHSQNVLAARLLVGLAEVVAATAVSAVALRLLTVVEVGEPVVDAARLAQAERTLEQLARATRIGSRLVRQAASCPSAARSNVPHGNLHRRRAPRRYSDLDRRLLSGMSGWPQGTQSTEPWVSILG